MKYFVWIVLVLFLAAFPVFADGEATALIEEIAQTIMESKSVISEYSVLAIEGLVARKAAYFDAVFPLVPILLLVGLLMFVIPIVAGNVFDWDFESALLVPIIFGGLLVLIFGIWWVDAFFGLRMFEAAPEVYVLKGLLGS